MKIIMQDMKAMKYVCLSPHLPSGRAVTTTNDWGFNADITGGYTDTPVSGDPATGDGE